MKTAPTCFGDTMQYSRQVAVFYKNLLLPISGHKEQWKQHI